MKNIPEFDRYAEEYDAALSQGLSVSGEDKIYFARNRIAWLADCLQKLGVHSKNVLDYGCGTGSATSFFFDLIKAESFIGLDVSSRSLDIATQTCCSEYAKYLTFDGYQPREEIDLAFCNGVFHHIMPNERLDAIKYIYQSLRPGGFFAFWENNPWNPGTRYVMNRVPFDKNAITITPIEAKRLLKNCGFEIKQIDFLFIFPKMLKWFRCIEPFISRVPLGAQYQVLCRKS